MGSNSVGDARAQLDLLLRIVDQEVNRLSVRLPKHTFEREELVGCAMVGLCEARARFNPRAGVPIGAYARLRIRGAIIDGMRNSVGLVRRRYFEQFSRDQRRGDQTQSLQQHLANLKIDIVRSQLSESMSLAPDEVLFNKETQANVRRALNYLAPQKRMLIKRLFGFDMKEESGETVAKDLGCHRSSIARRKAKILNELREVMEAAKAVACSAESKSHDRRSNILNVGRRRTESGSTRRIRPRRLQLHSAGGLKERRRAPCIPPERD